MTMETPYGFVWDFRGNPLFQWIPLSLSPIRQSDLDPIFRHTQTSTNHMNMIYIVYIHIDIDIYRYIEYRYIDIDRYIYIYIHRLINTTELIAHCPTSLICRPNVADLLPPGFAVDRDPGSPRRQVSLDVLMGLTPWIPWKNGDFPIKNGDLPIKHGDFPSFFVCLPEGINEDLALESRISGKTSTSLWESLHELKKTILCANHFLQWPSLNSQEIMNIPFWGSKSTPIKSDHKSKPFDRDFFQWPSKGRESPHGWWNLTQLWSWDFSKVSSYQYIYIYVYIDMI